MFYAAIHQYGIDFTNDVTSIVRFTSKSARDEFVSDEVFDGSYHREAVTRDEARRHFPEAFSLKDFHDGCEVLDSRDWEVEGDHEVFAATAYRYCC